MDIDITFWMLLKGTKPEDPWPLSQHELHLLHCLQLVHISAGAFQVERTCRKIASSVTGQDDSSLHSPICAGNAESEVAGVSSAALERLQKAGLKRIHLQALLDNLKPLAASGEQLQAGKRIRGPAACFRTT